MDDAAALWLLRHGQSEGNVIRAAAAADAEELDIPLRDMDVPLSDLGRRQAEAFGHWLREESADQRPTVVVSSPYRRAVDTADIVKRAAELSGEVVTDERLRERDLGMMDLLTLKGFAARFPLEAAHRKRLGKFYYRPPGGESWVDVALRCRSLRDSVAREHAGRRVLLVTHEVVIIMCRYLLENLGEQGALALSREAAIANCSLTAYTRSAGGLLEPAVVDWTAPLEESDVPVTESPDAPIASR
jgi:2,3-bisphosphoglycerate-dependent phosphoglycerate mutase